MKTNGNPRSEALTIVMDVLERGSFFERPQDKFAARLAAGCIERSIELDYYIDRVAGTKTKRQHPVVRNILRLGVYQLYYMDSVESYAAINESVKLAKKRGQARASGFVNAVLRRLSGEGRPHIGDVGIRCSMPAWICSLLEDHFGAEVSSQIMEAFLIPPKIHWRTNRNGTRYIQDLSAQQVCEMAGIRPGDEVLDVCAAPGGKAIHAADLAGESGHVLARDKTAEKAALICENIESVKMKNIEAQVWDALAYRSEDAGRYDVVLADLPCSGLGVLKRKPEIKYRLSFEDILSLADLQRRILDVVSAYVKPGGRLIYSTCTLSRQENEDNTEYFLQSRDQFSKIDEKVILPDDERDGFYVAVFEKRGCS